MRRYVISLGVAVLAAAFVLTACKKKVVESPTVGELYIGTYSYRIPSVVGLEKSDSMRFEIVTSTGYFATFYSDSIAVQPNAMFCDHSGSVMNFGTNNANFTPSLFDAGNCDTLHVARGLFTAVFSGASLTMTRNAGDTVYRFNLLRK